MTKKLIGYVGVDSGQLLLCDPCYIDSEWKTKDFIDIRIYENKITGAKLQFMKDFVHYESIIPKYSSTMNELIATGDWEKIDVGNDGSYDFSYDGCCRATLNNEGHGQLIYDRGHEGVGVAFRTAFGDGVYPVYAIYGEDGILVKVEVLFTDYEEEDVNLDL